jgi:hypothetical protein
MDIPQVQGELTPERHRLCQKSGNQCNQGRGLRSTAKSNMLGEERGDARERKRRGATINGRRGEQVEIQRGETAVDMGEKTWGVAFLSATELIRSFSRNSSWELGYGERRCGFNTKHHSAQGFAADPVYGRAKCLPMLGAFKT